MVYVMSLRILPLPQYNGEEWKFVPRGINKIQQQHLFPETVFQWNNSLFPMKTVDGCGLSGVTRTWFGNNVLVEFLKCQSSML